MLPHALLHERIGVQALIKPYRSTGGHVACNQLRGLRDFPWE